MVTDNLRIDRRPQPNPAGFAALMISIGMGQCATTPGKPQPKPKSAVSTTAFPQVKLPQLSRN